MKIDHKQQEVHPHTIQLSEQYMSQRGYMVDNLNTVQTKLMNSIQQSNEGQTFFVDNRITPQIRLMKVIQCMEMEEEGDRLQMKPTVQLKSEKDDLLQGKIEMLQQKPNKTGLPDNLKSGIESMSGLSMDDVRVHYNSNKPAQMQAHAYAQGTNIHIAPGQETHLPHEAWHVIQQKQGRVRPTMQMQGVSVNNDNSLEREADVMGGMAKNVVQNKNIVPSNSAASNNNCMQLSITINGVVYHNFIPLLDDVAESMGLEAHYELNDNLANTIEAIWNGPNINYASFNALIRAIIPHNNVLPLPQDLILPASLAYIIMTGSRVGDYAAAEIIYGHNKPGGYTWHHIEGIILGNRNVWCHMVLVNTIHHRRRHHGAVREYAIATGNIYMP